MIRTAISPRFAMRSRRNGGPTVSLRKDVSPTAGPAWPSRAGTVATRGSERDVAMLLSRVRVPLRLQHLERADDLGPRLRRTDHVVDVAAARGDVWVRELC